MINNKKPKLDLSTLIDNPVELMKNGNEMPNLDSSILKTAASVVTIDEGNLLAFDPRPIDSIELRKNPDSYIKDLCQISTQLLINQLFNLPVERVEDVIVAKLPKGTMVWPREKPLPKEKPLTKWEQYAKLKGIKKKKKGRMVFDETTKEWRPTWGYKKAKDKDDTNNWLVEIKKNEDPNQDFFSKRTQDKNERVAKNELQRLRNIARSTKKSPKIPGVGLTPNITDDKNQDKFKLKKAIQMAKTADASMSKFSEKIVNEDKVTRGLGKKRKFESNFNGNEKEKQIKIFERLTSNKDKSSKAKLNIEKAANKHLANENNDDTKKKFSSSKNKRSSSGKHRRVSVRGKGRRK